MCAKWQWNARDCVTGLHDRRSYEYSLQNWAIQNHNPLETMGVCDKYGIHMTLFPYMVIQPIVGVWRCYGLLWTLHCPKDHYGEVTVIWPSLYLGIRADVSETPDNALTTRMHCDYRLSIDRVFEGFNAICYTILRNNPKYIEGRNCRLSTVSGLFNKYSGLRPLDTLLSGLAHMGLKQCRTEGIWYNIYIYFI